MGFGEFHGWIFHKFFGCFPEDGKDKFGVGLQKPRFFGGEIPGFFPLGLGGLFSLFGVAT